MGSSDHVKHSHHLDLNGSKKFSDRREAACVRLHGFDYRQHAVTQQSWSTRTDVRRGYFVDGVWAGIDIRAGGASTAMIDTMVKGGPDEIKDLVAADAAKASRLSFDSKLSNATRL